MLYQTENPHGGDRWGREIELDFSANTNPLGTPPAVRRAVLAAAEYLDRYPDPRCRELTAAIARFEGVGEEKVLCGCGAAELIFSFCSAVRPKRALELAPTFSEYSAALAAVGYRVDRYCLKREEDFRLTPAFLSVLEAGDWDVLFLCNPNNPTGQAIAPDLLDAVLEICRRKSIRLFLDECFLDLTDGGEALSLRDKLAEYPGLFILKAFTKSYGMAALRLGYCLSRDPALLGAMGRVVQPWNVSLPAQLAGMAALGETGFLEETRRLIPAERAFLRTGLAGLGLAVCPSQANFLLFYSEAPLAERLLDRGILIRSCANYHGLGRGWYRAAVRRHGENRRLLAELEEILKTEEK